MVKILCVLNNVPHSLSYFNNEKYEGCQRDEAALL